MAVQAPDLQFPAVEIETVRLKFRTAEARTNTVGIQNPAVSNQLRFNHVQCGMVHVPELDVLHTALQRGAIALGNQGAPTVHQRELPQHHAITIALNGHITDDAAVDLRLHKDVRDVCLLFDVQIDIPVDAAVGHIIDHKSEGRNIQALPGVQTDCQDVLIAVFQVRRQIDGEGGIAGIMLAAFFAVDEDHGIVRRTIDGQQYPLVLPFTRNVQNLTVTADHLIFFFAEIVIRKLFACMGQPDVLPAFHAVFRQRFSKLPVVIDVNSAHKDFPLAR